MSADLLRRAAEKLRHAASEATAGSWTSLDDGDRLVSFTTDATIFEYVVDEPMSNGRNAAYIALLHPPVALALAEWLDVAAKAADARRKAEVMVGLQPGDLVSFEEERALAVARAILREPTDG